MVNGGTVEVELNRVRYGEGWEWEGKVMKGEQGRMSSGWDVLWRASVDEATRTQTRRM